MPWGRESLQEKGQDAKTKVVEQELDRLAQQVVQALRTRSLQLCVVESATGGLIADRLTRIPGASEVFWGGIVAYQYEAKSTLLGVSAERLRSDGAISGEVAWAMAQGGLRHILKTTPPGRALCLSTTGIAGPGGGTPEKPVGLCWLGLAGIHDREITQRIISPATNDRLQNKLYFGQAALKLVLSTLP